MESWVKENQSFNRNLKTDSAFFRRLAAGNVPESVKQFLESMDRLERLPLSYLIPQSEMLPPESLRFFYLDKSFIEAMKDGAMSIGRNCSRDAEHDTVLQIQLKTAGMSVNMEKIQTGFFLRSVLISGWNNIIVNCIDEYGETMRVIQRKLFGNEILLVIAEGKIAEVELAEPLETICFGIERGKEGPRIQVDVPGAGSEKSQAIPVPLKNEDERTLHVSALASAIQKVFEDAGKGGNVIKSAEYASQLTQRQKCVHIQVDWRE